MQKLKLNEVRQGRTRCTECPIRQKALFQVIADEYLAEAEQRRVGQYRLAARHPLYQEGAPASMAYTLFDGWLLLYRTHSDGSRQGLRVALPGDFVGYAALDDTCYSHSAMAITDITVCGFRQADLHAIIDHDLDIARQITNIQARYLAICESNVLGLGRKSAEQRIAFTIAELHHRLKALDMLHGDGSEMPFPLTQEMLGELTGLTPVHTNRVLRKLRNDGVLVSERQRIVVNDHARLVEIGEFQPDPAG
ncbi:MAG: Crp/Fnr family transcriptional regulator [Gammaproteobacteria bacterium]|nr:Crp/Fnr family transcriptional regulator [Gammaproteobacteria bacterium]